jgi:hypothetical protein
VRSQVKKEMAQPLSRSEGYSGQVCFVAPDGKFAKLLHDRTAILTWVFSADMPAGLKKGDRVTFDVCEYQTKGQVRRKAISVQIAAPLEVTAPKPMDDPDRVLAIRPAKPPRPPQPSAEALQKLVTEQPAARRLVRI